MTTMTRSEELAYYRKCDSLIAESYEVVHGLTARIMPLRKRLKALPQYTFYKAEERAAKIAACEAEIAELEGEREKARKAAQDLNNELYTGWSRFFLVQHIHNSTHCSSFRPTTRVGWLPDVSGLTEVEAVKEHGATLCTICFPSAPVELTTKPVDENVCPGKSFDRTKPYELRRVGKWGTCATCGQRVTLTSTGLVRKHKKA